MTLVFRSNERLRCDPCRQKNPPWLVILSSAQLCNKFATNMCSWQSQSCSLSFYGPDVQAMVPNLLPTATAMTEHRNRQLATLVRCREASELVGRCFDSTTFECIDFHVLVQITANLTRGCRAERDDAIRNLPWTQTEKIQTTCEMSASLVRL